MKVLLIFFETKNRVYPRVDAVPGYIDRTYFRVNIINQGDRQRKEKENDERLGRKRKALKGQARLCELFSLKL